LAGYVCAGAFFMLINLYPKGIGGGDIVMAAGLGAWLGLGHVLVMILLAFCLGALVSLPMLLTGRLKRKSLIPFGPYLALSSFSIWFFAGSFNSFFLWLFGNSFNPF
jgi:leader peptidase (prepilin peptidase) / N-methyltransferase